MGFTKEMNTAMQAVIDNNMIPYFKKGDYSSGITYGVRGVIEKFTGVVSRESRAAGVKLWALYFFNFWGILLSILVVVCLAAGVSIIHSRKNGWGWALLAVAGAILKWILNWSNIKKILGWALLAGEVTALSAFVLTLFGWDTYIPVGLV